MTELGHGTRRLAGGKLQEAGCTSPGSVGVWPVQGNMGAGYRKQEW